MADPQSVGREESSDTDPDITTLFQSSGMTSNDPARESLLKKREAVGELQINNIVDAQNKRDALFASPTNIPKPPKLEEIPKPRAEQFRDPYQAFQSPAIVLAGIASLFTRQPLTTAFNSAAATLKGFHDGDKEVMEWHRQQWKDSVEQALQQNQKEMTAYRAAMEAASLSVADRAARMQAIAAGVGDDNMIAAIREGNIDLQWKLLDTREQAQTKLNEFKLKFLEGREKFEEQKRHNLEMEGVARGGLAVKERKLESEAGEPMSEKAKETAARLLIRGNTSWMTNLGRGAQGRKDLIAVRNKAAEILDEQGVGPEAAAEAINAATAAFMGQKRGASALGQREALITGAISTAQATAPRVLETSEKVDRTQFPDINTIILHAQQKTGGENVIRFGIAVNTLANNYARALGAGSSVLTDTARKEALELMQTNWSKGQIRVAVDQLMIEMQSELQGAKRAQKEFQAGYGRETAAPSSQDLPSKAREQLSEGHVTTFQNGQSWTLENGQPKRVK